MSTHGTIAVSLIAALTIAPLATAPVDAVSKTFDGWTATCNNLRDCVVIGTAQNDLFYVRIARTAGVAAPVRAKLVLAAQDGLRGLAFSLVARGDGPARAIGPFPALRADGDATTVRAQLKEGESLALVESIRNAATLDYEIAGFRGALQLKGLSAALRFVDAQQQRVGTPTALVARGMTPLGQIPAPPLPPKIAVAEGVSADIVEKPVVSEAVVKLASAICDPDVVKSHEDTQGWRLGHDKVLLAVPCSQGAYNVSSALYFTDERGDMPVAAKLPQAAVGGGDPAPDNVATNVGFDPTRLELTAMDKGRGLSDCGSTATWVWTGSAFALLDASRLDACPGALPEDWPSIFQASRQ